MLHAIRPSRQPALICLSHLRWNFVFQRPQHLMTRFGRDRRVFFVEEPIFEPRITPYAALEASAGITVVVPHLPSGLDAEGCERTQRRLIDEVIERHEIADLVLWYYTPMALA